MVLKNLKYVVFLLVIVSTLSCNETPKLALKEFYYPKDSLRNHLVFDNAVKYKLKILNNPYNFDSTWNLDIYLNNNLVLYGRFSIDDTVFIPKSMIGKRVTSSINICKDSKCFMADKKGESFTVIYDTLMEQQFLNIVFLPDNERPDNFLLFCGWVW
ncbi:MAG: hypothetical protein KF706_11380 [Chitinophagales bacterium]|nr:hypothetical protein [Chitinophagales bacterium]